MGGECECELGSVGEGGEYEKSEGVEGAHCEYGFGGWRCNFGGGRSTVRVGGREKPLRTSTKP